MQQARTDKNIASINAGEIKKDSAKQAKRNDRIGNLMGKFADPNDDRFGDALFLCRGIAYLYMD